MDRVSRPIGVAGALIFFWVITVTFELTFGKLVVCPGESDTAVSSDPKRGPGVFPDQLDNALLGA